jgi:hypothetical protein
MIGFFGVILYLEKSEASYKREIKGSAGPKTRHRQDICHENPSQIRNG